MLSFSLSSVSTSTMSGGISSLRLGCGELVGGGGVSSAARVGSGRLGRWRRRGTGLVSRGSLVLAEGALTLSGDLSDGFCSLGSSFTLNGAGASCCCSSVCFMLAGRNSFASGFSSCWGSDSKHARFSGSNTLDSGHATFCHSMADLMVGAMLWSSLPLSSMSSSVSSFFGSLITVPGSKSLGLWRIILTLFPCFGRAPSAIHCSFVLSAPLRPLSPSTGLISLSLFSSFVS